MLKLTGEKGDTGSTSDPRGDGIVYLGLGKDVLVTIYEGLRGEATVKVGYPDCARILNFQLRKDATEGSIWHGEWLSLYDRRPH